MLYSNKIINAPDQRMNVDDPNAKGNNIIKDKNA
jgi:hypothetical protein